MPFCHELFTWCEGEDDGPLLLLFKMVDGLLGKVCIFWFFYFYMILIYSSRMMGFGFWGWQSSKGGNESANTHARSGSHVEHDPAFFKTQWPTIASQ
jgi:hypothetical protein